MNQIVLSAENLQQVYKEVQKEDVCEHLNHFTCEIDQDELVVVIEGTISAEFIDAGGGDWDEVYQYWERTGVSVDDAYAVNENGDEYQISNIKEIEEYLN